MKLATSLFLLLITLTSTAAWSCGSIIPCDSARRGLGDTAVKSPTALSMQSLLWPSSGMELMRRQRQELFSDMFTRISPQYSVTNTDNEIKISIDVPGVKQENVKVTLENDGKVLMVTGHREEETSNDGKSDDSSSQRISDFSLSFTLDTTVDIDKVHANLKDGVLVISAPKDHARTEKSSRQIPVTTDINGVIDHAQK